MPSAAHHPPAWMFSHAMPPRPRSKTTGRQVASLLRVRLIPYCPASRRPCRLGRCQFPLFDTLKRVPSGKISPSPAFFPCHPAAKALASTCSLRRMRTDKPRTKRLAMTATIAAKPTKRPGRRRRMSRPTSRGRLKAVAVDFVRLYHSPSTRKDTPRPSCHEHTYLHLGTARHLRASSHAIHRPGRD